MEKRIDGWQFDIPPFYPPPPQGRQFPTLPQGRMDTTAHQPLTGAYYAEFTANQLLVVGGPRLWDTR